MKKILIILLLPIFFVSCWYDTKTNGNTNIVDTGTKTNGNTNNVDTGNKSNEKKEEKDEKTVLKKNISFEKQIAFDSYSSFKYSDMSKKVEKMIDSEEKLLVLSKLLEYSKVNQLNKKLIKDIWKEYKSKAWFILNDMNWEPIINAVVKNLITWEIINTDNFWKWIFSWEFVKILEIPIYIEKKWYSSYWAFLYLNKEDNKLTIKKSIAKEIKYTWEEEKINFADKAEIILPKDWVVLEWTNDLYKWKINVEFTWYNKEEVLANETLRDSLTRAVFSDWEDRQKVVLETFGMIDINLYWKNWEKLNIGAWKKAIIKIPVSDLEWAKKEFWLTKSWKTKWGFWYLNKVTWFWENLRDWYLDIENKLYIAEVDHFSDYNFDTAKTYSRANPTYSTKDKIWKNWSNKVVATIVLTYEGEEKKYTHSFYDNWSWIPKKECAKRCNTTPTKAIVTWFAVDNTPPTVVGSIE